MDEVLKNTATLRQGLPEEPPLQVSKWLKVPVLITGEEMARLMESLGDFYIASSGGVVPQGKGFISHGDFLDAYKLYPEALSRGEKPDEASLRKIVPSVWTATLDPLYAVMVGEGKQVIRVSAPVIQLQHHRFDYSAIDGKFRSMVLGQDTVMWGVQFSYPQLYEVPGTHEIVQLNDTDAQPNTALFRQLQRWIRHETLATPFQIGEERVNVPIRLGKNCLPWINKHPQLSGKNLEVVIRES